MSTSEDEEDEYTFVHERDLRIEEGTEGQEGQEVPAEVSEEAKDISAEGDPSSDVVEGETEMPKLETIDSEACSVLPSKNIKLRYIKISIYYVLGNDS